MIVSSSQVGPRFVMVPQNHHNFFFLTKVRFVVRSVLFCTSWSTSSCVNATFLLPFKNLMTGLQEPCGSHVPLRSSVKSPTGEQQVLPPAQVRMVIISHLQDVLFHLSVRRGGQVRRFLLIGQQKSGDLRSKKQSNGEFLYFKGTFSC